jgi:hypothetical protein
LDLATAVSLCGANEQIILMDGTYVFSSLYNITKNMKADTGARPIITNEDGYPPSIAIGSGITVEGLWFGGLRPDTDAGARVVTMGAGSVVQDCTFFNYINAIQNGSDAHGNTFRRNRFVKCGYGLLAHPLYVANTNSTQEAQGVLSEENIMVGCEGYSVHYYHEPAYGLAQYNFIGDALYGLALQGDADGPVSGNRNIIWGCENSPIYRWVVSGTCDGNVWQGCEQPNTPDDGNYFVDPVPTSGTNPHVWQEADVVANLGNSSANIDAAIAALESAFDGTVQEIHDDATVEGNFAVLKAVIDTWKAVQ